jgi:hypothetical protein
MEVKKLFALASVTALTGFVATGLTAACSSTDVVTIPADAAASSSSSSGTVKPKKEGGSTSGAVVGDDDDTTGDDDDTTTTPTCLNKDPIDATKYTYVKSEKAVKGACTTKELSDFSAYFKAHSSDDDIIDTWPTSVSEKCSTCIFTDATGDTAPTTWGPLVITKDDQGAKSFDVNRGGCIETVSGKESCGRTYQQFQDCTIDACLKDCKTQADFTKCRQDATVLTTSCKDAFTAVKTECGEKNIGKFETACKGTTYTFEGPIKVLCITGAPTTTDAGTDSGTK